MNNEQNMRRYIERLRDNINSLTKKSSLSSQVIVDNLQDIINAKIRDCKTIEDLVALFSDGILSNITNKILNLPDR